MWASLAGAIGFEVIGTIALRASEGFRKRIWIIPVTVGYLVSFYLLWLTLALGMHVGIAYGVWTACGVALVAVAARVLFSEPLTWLMGLGIALIVATVLDLRVLVSGVGWMALGIALYVTYRRRQGLSLTDTHKVVVPKPAVEHEVEYESVLVAFEDDHYSPEAVSTAVRLAARRRRGIHVLVTITVPPNSPIDASSTRLECAVGAA